MRLFCTLLMVLFCASARAEDRRELVRIGALGGAGYANEHASDGMYGAGVLQVSAFPLESLLVSLQVEALSNYDRTYSTRLPAAEGDGLHQFSLGETMRRGRLWLGYEPLHFALADRDRVQLWPYAVGDLLHFGNDVWPQTALAFGGGLSSEVRVHEGLRLFGDLSYARVVHVRDDALDARLLYGGLAGTFRMAFGAAFAIHPRARFELRYQGEILHYGHASRILDTLLFGPVFHLR